MKWFAKRRNHIIYAVFLLVSIIIFVQFVKFLLIDWKDHSIEVSVKGFSPVTVYYSEFIPKKWHRTVVLLHENTILSTFESIKTTEILKNAGYKVISLTLPKITLGSSQQTIDYVVKGTILMETLKLLKSERAILVVPTLTASFGLPVVLRSGLPFYGLVIISPIDTDLFTPKEYKMLKIPTLVVYAKDDRNFQEKSFENLRLIPNVDFLSMPGDAPSCHIEYPEKFNRRLLSFLAKIS